MTEYAVVGKSPPRLDGRVKATGEAQFAMDVTLPGMLQGKILRSPHPHARIVRIDTSTVVLYAQPDALLPPLTVQRRPNADPPAGRGVMQGIGQQV